MALPEIVNASFGTEENAALEKYVYNQLTSLIQGLRPIRETKVEKWRKLYRGTPEQESRSFPWKNASNLVVQLVGTHVDMLRARVMASVFEVMPLFVTQLVGDWEDNERGEEQRAGIEAFLNLMGLEPKLLDLYRVESLAFDEAIKFGTVFVKTPWETQVEAIVAGERNGEPIISDRTLYDGPRPEKMRFEDFLVTPQAATLETAPFKCHIKHLYKQDIEERKFKGVYESAAIDKILTQPDGQGPTDTQKQEDAEKGVQTPDGFENARWDIYECWFPYFVNGHKYRLLYTYHYKTRTVLKKVFNFYPDNEEPFDMGRLGFADDGIYGYGFCEMLEHYQEELSTMHNQDIDNGTLLNTSVLRVSKSSKIDANFSIFPMAILPGEEGEIEKIQLGSASPGSIDRQKLTLELAQMRTGVNPGSGGSGGGTVNAKKGVYSAMGTFSVMQEGNRRSNINITDMRYLHLKLGRRFLRLYSEFGVEASTLKSFGSQAQYIKMALQNIKSGRLMLPIRAATASVNKELEKQNDMLLTTIMQRHHQGIAGILQGLQNPAMPEMLKEYLVGVIGSSNQLMAHILRNFGHDDTSRLLPETKLLKGVQGGNRPAAVQGSAGEGSGAATVVQDNGQEQGSSPQMANAAGSGSVLPISVGMPGSSGNVPVK